MNDNKAKQPLSTESYKGVRDFFPEDMFIQKYIFDVMRRTVEKFGYAEYNASVLEPTELYRSKTSEEIVNEQTYNFKDRGDRDVTLRPEMTPTVARMVAARRRELTFPVRWYSIPNVFRYEQPQRGRLREHWQLNVDIFGSASLEADVEIISVSYNIMKTFGAKDEDFVIKINSRKLMNSLFESWGLSNENSSNISRLIDKKNKITKEEFKKQAEIILKDKINLFLNAIENYSVDELPADFQTSEGYAEILNARNILKSRGINSEIDLTLMRGFDYYTGIVFEVFDTNPENKRSLFGGGRYDNLTANFGGEAIPGVGFGMGDVTIKDFLETRHLLPAYKSATNLFIATIGDVMHKAQELADTLRQKGVNVAVNLSNKKIGDQIKSADKQTIPFVLALGEDEIKNNSFIIKELSTGSEKPCSSIEDIARTVNK